MDYQRNTRYFSKHFSRNITILAVIGTVFAVVGALVWWYIYLGDFAIIVEILAIVGAITAVAAFSQRPSERYVLEQIESAQKLFHEAAMEAIGYPNDAETCTRLVWGFVPGTTDKQTKEGKRITDRVEFSLLHLKKGELRVYQQTTSLLKEESESLDHRLSLKTLTIDLDHDAHTLILTSSEESVQLAVFEPDYQLEEFLERITHRKG